MALSKSPSSIAARPGRVRVVCTLKNGVLDPHMTRSFCAVMAADVASAEDYLKTQPMGSYIFVLQASRGKVLWKTNVQKNFSLSIMIKYRTCIQIERVPIDFKGPAWTFSSQYPVFIEWNSSNQNRAHKLHVDSDIYEHMKLYWTEFMLYVGEKIGEICQDGELIENWLPSDSAGVRALSHKVQYGISVDIILKHPVAVRFNFKRYTIDVHLHRRKLSKETGVWRIKYPWNITFAVIKDVAVGKIAPLRVKSSFLHTIPRGSRLYQIPSGADEEDEPMEVDLLLSLLDRIETIDDHLDNSLLDVISLLSRLPQEKPNCPKLLALRLELVAFFLQLNYAPTAPNLSLKLVSEYIVHLAQQYPIKSIGAEKLAQLFLHAVELNYTNSYLLSIFFTLLQVSTFCQTIIQSDGCIILWKCYFTHCSQTRQCQEQNLSKCTTASKDQTLLSMENGQCSPNDQQMSLLTNDMQFAQNPRAQKAGEYYAARFISFFREEFTRSLLSSPALTDCAAWDDKRAVDSRDILMSKMNSKHFTPQLSSECPNCRIYEKTKHSMLFLKLFSKLIDTARTLGLDVNKKQVQTEEFIYELLYWENQSDSCWKQMYCQHLYSLFNNWILVMSNECTLDMAYFNNFVGCIHKSQGETIASLKILCKILASLPGHIDEREASIDFIDDLAGKIMEIGEFFLSQVSESVLNSDVYLVLDLWRLMLLSVGSKSTRILILLAITGVATRYQLALNIVKRLQPSINSNDNVALKNREACLGWLGSCLEVQRKVFFTAERLSDLPPTRQSTWMELFTRLKITSSKDWDNMSSVSINLKFVHIIPKDTTAFLQLLDKEYALAALREYLLLPTYVPGIGIPHDCYRQLFNIFLESYYLERAGHKTEYRKLLWDCLLCCFQGETFNNILEFTLSQLFPLKTEIEAHVPDTTSMINKFSSAPVQTGKFSLPPLQLSKVASLCPDIPQPKGTKACEDINPLDKMILICCVDMHLKLTQILLNSLICTDDHQHLSLRYCGRFGSPKGQNLGLDILFLFQMHLNSVRTKTAIPGLIASIYDLNPLRFQSKIRLLKLSTLFFSERVVFYRGFDPHRQGTFGTTYRCTSNVPLFRNHTDYSRQSIALKIIGIQKFPHERSVLYAVYNEVTILEHLRGNKAATQIYEYGLSSDGYFIAMEYCAMNLRDWRNEFDSGLTVRIMLGVFSKVCLAVSHIHASSVAHFDIKCDNVLVRNSELSRLDICLGDFGESYLHTAQNDFKNCQYTRGTEAIKSPEMLAFSEDIHFASDVWSLGCLLFELITGKMLFESEEWPSLFSHLTKSNEPIMTLEHKRLLYESILTKSEDESEAQNQLIVVSDLLNFILVRQPQQRPDLKAIHDKLSNYELQLADKSIPLTPALTPIDIMCNQVRILDMHRPERWDKIKLFHRIYLGCKAEWDGESVLYLTCCTNTATIRPTSCLAVPQPHSTSSSAQEIHFAEHFLKQVQLLCKLLWDLYLTNKTVLVSVTSQEMLRGIMPAMFVFQMTFFGLSTFEIVKQLWRPNDTALIPKNEDLAAILCWEEKRCWVSFSTPAYQCICGTNGIQTSTTPTLCCTSTCPLCSICIPLLSPIKLFLNSTSPLLWIDVSMNSSTTVNIAQWDHWQQLSKICDEELVLFSGEWKVYRCSTCKMITKAQSEHTTKRLAMIKFGKDWNYAQRHQFFHG